MSFKSFMQKVGSFVKKYWKIILGFIAAGAGALVVYKTVKAIKAVIAPVVQPQDFIYDDPADKYIHVYTGDGETVKVELPNGYKAKHVKKAHAEPATPAAEVEILHEPEDRKNPGKPVENSALNTVKDLQE